MSDWIDSFMGETSEIPSPPIFRLWSAITAVSGALERKTWMKGSAGLIYPTLYTLLVGPPASGKTNAIRRVRDIWAKIPDMILSPDNVTKASLIDVMSRAFRQIPQADAMPLVFHAINISCSEFGVFFPQHDTEFLSVMNAIYDGLTMYCEERRTKGKIEIERPHMVILAGTQPDFLASFMPEEAWGMGFASRLIMIYADEAPQVDLFTPYEENMGPLAHKLEKVFHLVGEFIWTNEAKAVMRQWRETECEPCPTHHKLSHYVNRRFLHTAKLAMISSASRCCDLEIAQEDVERARSWLLGAEKFMPDIFASMKQKSDSQVLLDLHFFMYQLWASVAREERKPVMEDKIYEFLSERVPSSQIGKIIEVAEKTGMMKRGMYPCEWIPRPL